MGSFFGKQGRLELDEIAGVLLQVGLDGLAGVLPGKAVGVFPFREGADAHVHALFQNQVDAPQGSPQAGRIPVEEDHDVLGEPPYQPDLLRGQGGAARGHHILDAALVQLDHVGIPLYQVAEVFAGNGLFGVVNAIEHPAFVVDFAFGRIQVLSRFLVGAQGTAPKAEYPPAQGMDREKHPPLEAVYGATGLPFCAAFDQGQARFFKEFELVAFLQGSPGKDIPLVGVVAQAELPDGVVCKAALPEIREADGLAAFRVPEAVFIELPGKFAHQQHALALPGLFGLLIGALGLFDLDLVLAGQVADRLRVGQVLVFHEEGHRVTALAAAEVLPDLLDR